MNQTTLRVLLLTTDLGFITYWVLTLGRVLPAEMLFANYDDETIMAWNLSFLPLDLLVSATGLGALAIQRACPASARALLMISLVTTSISGLQAIAFWAIRHEFDLAWWAPNLFLFLWPLPFIIERIWYADGASSPTSTV